MTFQSPSVKDVRLKNKFTDKTNHWANTWFGLEYKSYDSDLCGLTHCVSIQKDRNSWIQIHWNVGNLSKQTEESKLKLVIVMARGSSCFFEILFFFCLPVWNGFWCLLFESQRALCRKNKETQYDIQSEEVLCRGGGGLFRLPPDLDFDKQRQTDGWINHQVCYCPPAS